MYPFMNCKNQLLQAKRLCHDDGYWYEEGRIRIGRRKGGEERVSFNKRGDGGGGKRMRRKRRRKSMRKSVRHLTLCCRVRHVRDFHCTGGFIASEPGEAEKWKYIDHFAISMALLVGAVIIGLIVRAYMLNRLSKHAGVDHRLWWLRGQTEQSTPPDREIVQITV